MFANRPKASCFVGFRPPRGRGCRCGRALLTRPSCAGTARRSLEFVVCHGEIASIAALARVTGAGRAAFAQTRRRMFHPDVDRCDGRIHLPRRRQFLLDPLMVVCDTVRNAPAPQMPTSIFVGDRRQPLHRQLPNMPAVMMASGREREIRHHAATLGGDVPLVAVIAPPVLLRERGVRIACGEVVARRILKAVSLDRAADAIENPAIQVRLAQAGADFHQSGFIRRGSVPAQTGEAAKADAVAGLLFGLRDQHSEHTLQQDDPDHHRACGAAIGVAIRGPRGLARPFLVDGGVESARPDWRAFAVQFAHDDIRDKDLRRFASAHADLPIRSLQNVVVPRAFWRFLFEDPRKQSPITSRRKASLWL